MRLRGYLHRVARRRLLALLAAAGCLVLAVAVWALVFRTGPGQAADQAAFSGFLKLQGTAAEPIASRVATLCNPAPYAVLVGVLLLLALALRGPRHALASIAVITATNAVTQLLKPALAGPRLSGPVTGREYVLAASWPSGHSTAAMALALCAVLIAPAAVRRLVAVVGGLFAIAVAYSVVLLGWHLPSDALGGFAVAGAGVALALWALWSAEARWPSASRPPTVRAAWAAQAPAVRLTAGVAVAVVAAVVVRTALWLPSQREQAAFLAVAGSIVVLALALSAIAARAQPA